MNCKQKPKNLPLLYGLPIIDCLLSGGNVHIALPVTRGVGPQQVKAWAQESQRLMRGYQPIAPHLCRVLEDYCLLRTLKLIMTPVVCTVITYLFSCHISQLLKIKQ